MLGEKPYLCDPIKNQTNMKRFYSLFLAVSLISTGLFSQSIQLSTKEGQILSNGASIDVFRSIDTSADPNVELHLKNISSSVKEIKVIRRDIILPNSQVAYFCFAGFCYPSNITESPNSLTLSPGQSDPNFSGHIIPAGTGNSVVYYKFFTVTNPNDTVSVYIQTKLWHNGISENSSTAELSRIYPNPVSGKFTAEYTVTTGGIAKLYLKNLLGVNVYEMNLSPGTGKAEVNVAGLPEGLYFCSVVVDGMIRSTQRVLISR
jgi:hypothetical protein